MLAKALSWIQLPSSTLSGQPQSHLNLLDLPFDVLEEIMTYALDHPPSPWAASATAQASSRAGCVRTCKALNSAGEKELYRLVRVSSKASWVALFGHRTGLLTADSTRNVARFVHEITIGREINWLWGLPHEEPSETPISSSLAAFPSLKSVTILTSVLSHLSHRPDPPTPLDILVPQLLTPLSPSGSNPTLTLSLLTHTAPHPSASDIASFLYLFTMPYRLVSSTTNNQVVLPRHLGPIRETLHGALGLAFPPSLDTLHMDGCPLMESLRSCRTGHPFLVLAGSCAGWSFRRLVLSLPDALTEFDGADVYRRLFSMDTEKTPIPIPGGEALERVDLRVGRRRESQIREMWARDASEGRLSENGRRLAGMVWFVNGDGDGGEAKLVEEE